MRVTFSVIARSDIINIGIYIAGDNPVRAFSFTEELENKAMSLSSMPFKGVRRDMPVPNLRLVPHGAYNIYYKVRESDIFIVRILHSARDISSDDFIGN